ncbi:GPI mannosyltransferase 3 [Bagarius yarrelli]|uniref:Mannosyltransferase n=1 Tax=Bagarius yarrelli TaxID=175774 RepID=A0A556VA61_BAGYA|nr:GPI mannosyltransferase 3 [Bagarius yarrelli]
MERIRARRFLPFGSSGSAETVKLRTRKSKLYRKENTATSRVHSENLYNTRVFRLFTPSHFCAVDAQILLPRVLQALLAALADVKLYQIARRCENPDAAKWTYFCQLCSWFTWYCSTRTLTNSMETTLSVLALSYYPLHGSRTQRRFVTLTAATLIDCTFYGTWTFVQWNFLKFNVLHNVAAFYGTHPWHWYLTQGFVVVIGPHLPFFLHGCTLAAKRHRVLLISVVWTLSAYRKPAAGALLLLNLLPALYTGLVHQRGVLDVMDHLQHLCDSHSSPEPRVLFLMPCHSTPLYSHLHCPISLRFLECPPDLRGDPDYVDESAKFYMDPLGWLGTSYPNGSSLPSHLVLFHPLEEEISTFLDGNGFEKQVEIFHTHFPEGRVGKQIHVYRRYKSSIRE